MDPLSASDCRALSSAIQTIYSPTDISQFPSTILSAIKEVLSCNTICYNEVNILEARMSWITEPASALPGPILQEMFNRHLHEHPLVAHSGSPGNTRSLRISDFLSRQQFHRLALYNEYYRPMGVEYQLGTEISASRHHIIAVGLDRNRLDFSESERLCLDLLRPHLIQSYRNLQILDLMRRSAEADEKRVIVVNRAGQVQLASDDVWRILAAYFDMRRFRGSLPDALRSWVRYERSRSCEESEVPSPSVPLVVNKETGKLTMHFLWGGKGSDHDLIILEEERAEPVSRSGNHQKLTRRETEILSWLSQGKTNAEIGSALSISPGTVRKHLEHIYAKLEVHGRSAALVRSLGL